MNSKKVDVVREIKNYTQNRGADIVMEAVGVTSTVQSAVASVKNGGALTLIGNFASHVEIPLQAIVTREISVNGSYVSSDEYLVCIDLITRGAINVDALISAVASLSEGESWFRRLYNREPGLMKVILIP